MKNEISEIKGTYTYYILSLSLLVFHAFPVRCSSFGAD